MSTSMRKMSWRQSLGTYLFEDEDVGYIEKQKDTEKYTGGEFMK